MQNKTNNNKHNDDSNGGTTTLPHPHSLTLCSSPHLRRRHQHSLRLPSPRRPSASDRPSTAGGPPVSPSESVAWLRRRRENGCGLARVFGLKNCSRFAYMEGKIAKKNERACVRSSIPLFAGSMGGELSVGAWGSVKFDNFAQFASGSGGR